MRLTSTLCIFAQLLIHKSTSFTLISQRKSILHCKSVTRNKVPYSLSRIHNVPPSIANDSESVKDAADRQRPPQSFYQLQIDSAKSAKLAMEDGYKLLEIEFPPLPANILDLDDVSAYEVSQENTKLAIEFGKFFTQDGKKVAVLLPDEAELRIATEDLGLSSNPHPGMILSSLRRSDPDDDRLFKPEQVFISMFGQRSGTIKPIKGVDMYIVVTVSAQELPDVEDLHAEDPEKTIVFYNLKLETLRGDLGAPAFPPRSFQDRFLSKVKPVYYLLPRSYTRNLPTPPFLLNYQGVLFRAYPGCYQSLLDTGTGSYRKIAGNDIRPGLGEFKQELTDALEVEGAIKDEGKVMGFLRTGYKSSTWWEGEREDCSNDWRT